MSEQTHHSRRGIVRWGLAWRPIRWSSRLVLVLVALLGVLWLVQLFVLPSLVRSKAASGFAALGYPDAAFQVRNVGLWDAELVNISGGSGADAPRIDLISIHFTPLSILHGQLREIEVTGAKIIIDAATPGGIFHGPSSGRSRPSGAAFTRINFQSSQLIVRSHRRDWVIPVQGTLVTDKAGPMRMDATADLFGSTLAVAGTIDPAHGAVSIQAAADRIDLASASAVVSDLGWINTPLRAGGWLNLHAEYQSSASSGAGTISANLGNGWLWADIAGSPLTSDQVAGKLALAMDRNGKIVSINATVASPSVEYRSTAARDISLTIQSAPPVAGREDSPTANVALAMGELRLSSEDLVLHGVHTIVRLSENTATPTPELQIWPGSHLWIDSAEAASVALDKADVAQPLVDAAITQEATFAAAKAGLNREPWRLSPLNLRITSGEFSAAISGQSAQLKGLAGVLNLVAKIDSENAVIHLLADSWLTGRELTAPGVTVSGWRGAVGEPASTPLVHLRWGDGKLAYEMSATAEPASAIHITSSRLHADVGSAMILATAKHSADGKSSASVNIHLEKTSASSDWQGLALDGIAADVPISWNAPVPAGHFAVASVAWKSGTLPPISGQARMQDNVATWTAAIPLFANGTLSAIGSVDLSGPRTRAQINFTLPRFDLQDGLAVRHLYRGIGDAQITGTFAANGEIRIDGARIVPLLTLTADNASIASAAGELNLNGLSGSVSFDGLSPLSTAGGQRLVARQLKKGKFDLANGVLDFHVENGDSILIEQSRWEWAGGYLYADGFRFHPQSRSADLVLIGDHLQFKDLLAILLPGKATGSGLMYARLPVSVRPDHLAFGDGYIYSIPGQGHLAITDPTTIENLLRMIQGQGVTSQIETRAVAALQDFQYDVLRMDFRRGQQGLDGRAIIQGWGGQGANRLPLNLDITISGLDGVFNRFAGYQKAIQQPGRHSTGKAGSP